MQLLYVWNKSPPLPVNMDLTTWIRPNILQLKPYSSARDEYSGEAMVFLDANENPWNFPYNRYPDPLQRKLKSKIAEIKGVPDDSIFLGNGSDEPIDLLIRAFCEPGVHNIVQMEPTYGMYQVAAGVNNVEVLKVPLTPDYQLNVPSLMDSVSPLTRMIFLCSPNNPTGNALNYIDMETIIRDFEGPVVIDEAYIDFSPGTSFLPRLREFQNLIILQTFSKAWGMAGIRLGMAFAHPAITGILNKIKYPYNLNILTQHKALELLSGESRMKEWVKILSNERQKLTDSLRHLPVVEKVWPSDANFLLVRVNDARKIYEYLVEKAIIVRDRSRILLCENSLRITVGTPEENKILIDALKQL
jgi:histidinol-phosphate aminotransferase